MNTDSSFTLSRIHEHFHDEETARNFFEKLRWPDGPVCPHCGETTTNRVEGFFGLVKRSVFGTYHQECKRRYSEGSSSGNPRRIFIAAKDTCNFDARL
jgi:hypothetical protein